MSPGTDSPRSGLLFLVTAPSGAGKDSVIGVLRDRGVEMTFAITALTRPPREGERDGIEHFFLTEAEFRGLGEVLDEMEAEGSLPAHAAAAIRLLMLTGCRRNEIMELEWKHVDLGAGELRLPDTKTGARLVPLSPAAARVLAELRRIEGNPWVIAGTRPGRRLADLNHYWERVRERADLEGVRLHDLRHSFASRALGESLSMIGRLLGHNKIDTTARYAHLARDSIKASSARVADSIGADILKGAPGRGGRTSGRPRPAGG